MFLNAALALAIMTGSAPTMQTADASPGFPRASTPKTRSHPYEMAGPVHIRFRTAGSVVTTLGNDDLDVRRELALHAGIDEILTD